MVTVTVPIRTTNPNNGAHGHWAIQARKRAKEKLAVGLYLSQHKPPRLPVIVTLIRISPGRMDSDGLRAALKSTRDKVAVWLGLPLNTRGHAEDNNRQVHWVYMQGRGVKGEHAVRIEVNHVEQAEVDRLRSLEEWAPDKAAL